MLSELRKLPAMHYVHGVDPYGRKCKDCCSFQRFEYRGRRFCKCEAYGISSSEATDWGVNYLACGLFNIPCENQTPLFETFRKKRFIHIEDGQIGMEV